MIPLPVRRCWRLAAGIAAALVIQGCATVGPDFEPPQVDWLADWQPDLYGQLGGGAEPAGQDLRFWWLLFDDEALNELIDIARRENPSLRIAGLRILESRAALGIAESGRYPQLQQLGGAISYVNTQQHGGTGPGDASLTAYQAAFNVGWELDFWGRFRRSIESADAVFLASIASHQDVQVLLSAQVVDLYFAYRTTQMRVEIANRNATLQARSLDITRQLYEEGQSSELDLQQARTQYLSTQATIPALEITLAQVRNAMAVLLARAPGDVPELDRASPALPALEPRSIQGVPAHLVLRRPDVRSAAWQAAAQSARIGIAKADLYPAISLIGSIGWSGDSLDATPDTGSLAVGPALTWNVFDYGRIRNNVRVQDARLQQSLEAFESAVLQAAREIDDAAIGVAKTREQMEILGAVLGAAERSLQLATSRYQEGYSDFQRVLDAQRVLFTQADREIVNRGNHISAVIALYKSMGGGWLEVPVDALVPASTRETMQSRSNWGELLSAPLPEEAEHPSPVPEASP